MTVVALRWFKVALVLQALLVGYFLTIEVVALFPWNDLAVRGADHDLRQSIAYTALPLVALTGIFALGVRPLAFISLLGYGIFLIVQLWMWWEPYVMGADAAWTARHAELYANTMKALPSFGAHIAPDAQHLALQALTLLTLWVSGKSVACMKHL